MRSTSSRCLATFLLFALVPLALSPLGCATADAQKNSGVRTSREYYPLAVGNRWTYSLQPAPPDTPPQEAKILDKDGAGFFVDNHGGKLAPRTDGIFDGLQGRYLLQEPVTVGHEWIAVPTATDVEKFKITSVDTALTVAAGSFSDCVVVESKGPQVNPLTKQKGIFTMTATYAPGVGLVLLTQRFQPEGEADVVVGKMELVSYDVKPTE